MNYSNMDSDATVIMVPNVRPPEAAEPHFQVVASVDRAPRNSPYIAQQTSVDEFLPGLNPLVSAASPLLMETLSIKGDEDIQALRVRLEAAVRAFESQALTTEVEMSHVTAAKYLLCTALDESITTSPLGESGEWSRQALLSTFHNETWGGEKFFQILDRCMQQPARNLYLLELMYLLISLGFEGKYRVMDRGPVALEALRDKIYRQISLLRGEFQPDLSKKIESGNFKQKIYNYVPLSLVFIVVIFCLAVTFFGFSYTLDQFSSPLVEKYQTHASAQEVSK